MPPPPPALDALPDAVLENIARLAADDLLGPPAALPPLLAASRRLHAVLALDANPHLYARIFAAKFDTAAASRRFGPDLTVKSLATELRRRCLALKHLRASHGAARLPPGSRGSRATSADATASADASELAIDDVLTTAYIMMLENDGKNETQLREYANLEDWLAIYWFRPDGASAAVRLMAADWWPAPSRRNDMAMWLFWFLLTPGRYTNDDIVYREILSVLKPLALGAHKYEICNPSWTHFIPPLPDLFGLGPAPSDEDTPEDVPAEDELPEPEGMPAEDDDAEGDRAGSQLASLYSFAIPLKPAPLAGPAILAYLSLANQLVMAHARATGRGDVAVVTPLALASGYPYDLDAEPIQPSNVVNAASTSRASASLPGRPLSEKWDYEWRRCISLGMLSVSPTTLTFVPSMGISAGSNNSPAFVFLPGSAEGIWEGMFTYTEFTSYAALLSGAAPQVLQRSLIAQHRQTWKLREYHLLAGVSFPPQQDPRPDSLPVDPNGNPVQTSLNLGPLTPGDPLRAYIPEGSALVERREEGTLEVFDPAYLEELEKSSPRSPSSHRRSHSQMPYPSVKYTHFQAKDLRAGDNGGEGGADYVARIRDVIIIGEGHSAWGQFNLYGRVRPCDGFISFSKEYVDTDRGKWLYRGYLVGTREGNLVGRWRDVLSPRRVHGYEGCFAMSRRR